MRILGDVAIIHARTSYTTADGEQRNGRYTDVWARRDGKWLAVIGACDAIAVFSDQSGKK